jgi:GMP synthase (glutamine-hydrolysing)
LIVCAVVYVFDDEAAKLTDVDFLAQGTLYTDVIESGTKTVPCAKKSTSVNFAASSSNTYTNSLPIILRFCSGFKSHHNVGGLPEDMEFELIEPINTLFKDEVRALGNQRQLILPLHHQTHIQIHYQ